MAVQVFYCSMDPLRDETLFAHYFARVPEERRARIDLLRAEDDRQRSLAAGVMLHSALNAQNVPLYLRRVERSQSGKPFLPDLPLHFSLSHSGTVALCAIAPEVVGADVQTRHKPSQALLRRVCADTELKWLAVQQDEELAFTTLWARKESLLKALGRTISSDLRQFACLEASVNVEGKTLCFAEKTLFDLPSCVCCADGEDVIWVKLDLASEEIQNSFDSWT